MNICKKWDGKGCISQAAGHCLLDSKDKKVGCLYKHEMDTAMAVKALTDEDVFFKTASLIDSELL